MKEEHEEKEKSNADAIKSLNGMINSLIKHFGI
jgi:hypothetical protein